MRPANKGFTLIELLVAISILAVLSVIGLVVFSGIQAKVRDGKRVNDLQQIQTALEEYYQDNGFYPTGLLSLSPKYLVQMPSDPKTGVSYSSSYIPKGTGGSDCNSSSVKCISYEITANSETKSGTNGGNFKGTQDSIVAMVVSGGGGSTPTPTSVPATSVPAYTPVPTPSPVSTPTATPTSAPAPTPTPVPCVLNSARWRTFTATAGDTVYLDVTGNSSNCNGKVVTFEVREADVGGYDPVNINPAQAIFTGSTVSTSWTAEWQNDCLGLCNPPEYYFVATLDNRFSLESSNQLVVNQVSTPTPTPTPTPTSIPKLSNGSTCSSGSECASGYCYVDADGDRYAPSSGTKKCQVSSQLTGTDCYDSNANTYPGQTGYFSSNRGDGSFDYNCDGLVTKDPRTDCVNNCALDTCLPGGLNCQPGYYSSVPACGQSGQGRWTLNCWAYETNCSGSTNPYGRWCTGQEYGVPSSSCQSYKVSSTGYSATMLCR